MCEKSRFSTFSLNMDFMQNLSDRKNKKFPHCALCASFAIVMQLGSKFFWNISWKFQLNMIFETSLHMKMVQIHDKVAKKDWFSALKNSQNQKILQFC